MKMVLAALIFLPGYEERKLDNRDTVESFTVTNDTEFWLTAVNIL